MQLTTRKLTRMALLTAIALTIFMVEAQIPALVPVPGVKLGLANIVTVFAVYTMGSKEGALILAARIFLGAVFAGNFSTIFYSAAGGACAILVTIGLKRILTHSQLWQALWAPWPMPWARWPWPSPSPPPRASSSICLC